jgi:hypothetical protein
LALAATAEGGGAIHVLGALTSQGHSMSLEASKKIVLNPGASVMTNGGPLTLKANEAGTMGGNFVGIDVNGATLNAGTGAMTLLGKGGTTGDENYGVALWTGAQLLTTSGVIDITGTGGSGTGMGNRGVVLFGGAQITSAAPIHLHGTGGASPIGNQGVAITEVNTLVTSSSAISIQ